VAEKGHLEAVRLLVKEGGADVESKDSKWGWTPLTWATYNGHPEAVKFLVQEAGADVESKENWGQTASDLAPFRIREGWLLN